MKGTRLLALSAALVLVTAVAAFASGSSEKSQAQPSATASYPVRTINYEVPFAAGGESDITARLQQTYLEKILGQKVVVTDKPGGGGALGWSEIAKGRPDGYTLMGCNLPHIILQPLMRKDTGFTTDQIQAVFYFESTPNLLVVPNDSPFKTLADFIAYAKQHPGAITLGGSGSWSANQLGVIELEKAANIKLTYIPFTGTGTALPAILGHHVTGLMTYTDMGLIHKKDFRSLAVASDNRVSFLPNVPTFKELGYDIVDGAYRGVAVPPGTPETVRKKLENAFAQVNKEPQFQEKMAALGINVENYGIEASKKLVADREVHYKALLKELGVIK